MSRAVSQSSLGLVPAVTASPLTPKAHDTTNFGALRVGSELLKSLQAFLGFGCPCGLAMGCPWKAAPSSCALVWPRYARCYIVSKLEVALLPLIFSPSLQSFPNARPKSTNLCKARNDGEPCEALVKPTPSCSEAAAGAQQVPGRRLPVPSYENTPLARFAQLPQMQPERLPGRRGGG